MCTLYKKFLSFHTSSKEQTTSMVFMECNLQEFANLAQLSNNEFHKLQTGYSKRFVVHHSSVLWYD